MTESKLLGSIESWLIGSRIVFEDHQNGGIYVPDRALLVHIIRGQYHMALELKALNDSAAKLQADVAPLTAAVQALTAAHTDTSAQTAIDAVTAAVTGVSTAVEALTKGINDVLNPVPPETPAPPAA